MREIDDRENGGIDTDAEGESKYGDGGETGGFTQHSQGGTNVGKKAFDGGPLPNFAAAFFEESRVPEFAAGSARGFFAGHATRNELVDFFTEMLFDLGGEIAVEAAAKKYSAECVHDFTDARTCAIPSCICSKLVTWRLRCLTPVGVNL